MANHCIDVACASCGACYCLRCGDGNGPNEGMLEVIKSGLKGHTPYDSIKCLFCGGVVYDSSILHNSKS